MKKATYNLYRSKTNRILAGVCGGLGEAFGIDPVIIRLITILIVLAGGSGVLVYIILWLILPEEGGKPVISQTQVKENAEEIKSKFYEFEKRIKVNTKHHDFSKNTLGWILLIIGVFFFLDNIGILRVFSFDKIWPVILILIGFAILNNHGK